MSYPMNEFVTDLEKADQMTGESNRVSVCCSRSAIHEAGNRMSSAVMRVADFCKSVQQEVNAGRLKKIYPPILIGIGAGALFGYLYIYRRIHRSK